MTSFSPEGSNPYQRLNLFVQLDESTQLQRAATDMAAQRHNIIEQLQAQLEVGKEVHLHVQQQMQIMKQCTCNATHRSDN